jgi:hypothetical protein
MGNAAAARQGKLVEHEKGSHFIVGAVPLKATSPLLKRHVRGNYVKQTTYLH